MRKILLYILLVMPLACAAQSTWERPLTPKERLEQAKKEQDEAKKAMKAAKRAEREARKNARKSRQEGTGTPHATDTITANGWSTVSQPSQKKPESTSPAPAVREKDAPYVGEGVVPEVDGKIVFSCDVDLPGRTAQQVYEATYAFLDSLSHEEEQIESGIVLFNRDEHAVVAKYCEWLTFSESFLSLDRTKFKYTMIANCSDGHLHLSMERLSYAYEESNPKGGLHVTAEEWISDKKAVNKKRTRLYPGPAKFRRKTVDRKNQIFNEIVSFLKQ